MSRVPPPLSTPPRSSAMRPSGGGLPEERSVGFDMTGSTYKRPAPTTATGTSGGLRGLNPSSMYDPGSNPAGTNGWYGAGSDMRINLDGTPMSSGIPSGSTIFVLPSRPTDQTASNPTGSRLNDEQFKYLGRWKAAMESLAAGSLSESKTYNADGTLSAFSQYNEPTVTEQDIRNKLERDEIVAMESERATKASQQPRRFGVFGRPKPVPINEEDRKKIRDDTAAASSERSRQEPESQGQTNHTWQNTIPSGLGSTLWPHSHPDPSQPGFMQPTMPTSQQTPSAHYHSQIPQPGQQPQYDLSDNPQGWQNPHPSQPDTMSNYTVNGRPGVQTDNTGRKDPAWLVETPDGTREWHFDPTMTGQEAGTMDLEKEIDGKRTRVTMTWDFSQAGKGGPTQVNARYINGNQPQPTNPYAQPGSEQRDHSWFRGPQRPETNGPTFDEILKEKLPPNMQFTGDTFSRFPNTDEYNMRWASLGGDPRMRDRADDRNRRRAETLAQISSLYNVTDEQASSYANQGSRYLNDLVDLGVPIEIAKDTTAGWLDGKLTEKTVQTGVTAADRVQENLKRYWDTQRSLMYDDNYAIPADPIKWTSLNGTLAGDYNEDGKMTTEEGQEFSRRANQLDDERNRINRWGTNLLTKLTDTSTNRDVSVYEAASDAIKKYIDTESFIGTEIANLNALHPPTATTKSRAYTDRLDGLEKLDTRSRASYLKELKAAGVYTLKDASRWGFRANPLNPPPSEADRFSTFQAFAKTLGGTTDTTM